ncbi:MAG TPA: lysylphosphatidylglycerol synthase transmembrane domain-containing protein [Gemmataceae bacterium]|nr:lysylphosphatidylglycerol synthase transmembrane domain-containing protein [Gemmataceae bacterium]
MSKSIFRLTVTFILLKLLAYKRVAITFILLGLLAYKIDWGQLGNDLGQSHIQYWFLAIIVYLLSQVASSMRWRWLAAPLGFHQPLSRFLSFYFIGMVFNMLLPTGVGGDVVRAWYLDGRSGRRLAAFLSVLADRGSGLLVLLALACLGVLFYPYSLDWRISAIVWATAALALSGLGMIAAIALWKPKSVRAWDAKYVPDHHRKGLKGKVKHLRARLRALVLSLSHAFMLYLHRPTLLLGTTALSVIVQAANVLLVWLIGQALEIPAPAAYYWILVPMVSLAVMIPIDINGAAIRPYVTVALLAPLAVSSEKATALAFMWLGAVLVASMTGIPFYLFGRYPRFFRSPEDSKTPEEMASGSRSGASNMEVRFDDGSFRGDPNQRRAGEPSPA